MENYNEVLNNVEVNEVVEGATDLVEATDLVPVELDADEILKQTGKDALMAAGLIAAGLAVTYVGCKFVVPKVMGKIKEAKAKREQAKFEAELTQVDKDEE